MKAGLIGIVRDEMKEDFWGTLERVAALGYEGIEFGAGTLEQAGVPLAEMKARFADLGLTPIAHHATKYSLAETGDAVYDACQALDCKILVLSWGPCDSREQLLEDAELYNRIGERSKAAGIQLTYHNHDHEFQRFDGETGFDILLGNTEPDLLHAHIDVAWVTFGGVDPVEVIRRYAGRCPALHMKDFVGLEPGCDQAQGDRQAARFTEVGTGIVDLPGIVAAARESGVEWLTVEQDRPRDLPPMESIAASLANLRAAMA